MFFSMKTINSKTSVLAIVLYNAISNYNEIVKYSCDMSLKQLMLIMSNYTIYYSIRNAVMISSDHNVNILTTISICGIRQVTTIYDNNKLTLGVHCNSRAHINLLMLSSSFEDLRGNELPHPSLQREWFKASSI